MKGKQVFKFLLVGAIFLVIYLFFHFELNTYLSLAKLKDGQLLLKNYYVQNEFAFTAAYFVIYVVATALSLPGAAILTLAGGAIFGLVKGVIVVSFSSTIGATLAFLMSRFILRETIEKKFSSKFKSINEGIEKEGAFYLFSLRLIPVFPFFLINLVMGLTKIKTMTFFFVSQVGMLAGTAAYVNAGTELSKIESLKGILSPGLLGAFVFIGILPLVSKGIISCLKSRKVMKGYKKPKKFDNNIVVIGGGSAGLVTSYIAAAVKAKVTLIEKHKMGGDCLNTGCVPSKALIKSAKVFHQAKRFEEFGINPASVSLNFKNVMDRVQRVIKKIEPHDSIERYTGLGVDCVTGEAKIISPYEVEVNGKVLTTKNIVVATGARPFVPPIPGLDKVNFLTSDNIWNLEELPKKLLVLGGGPIGCELTQSFARLGAEVHIVEMAPRLMVREDEDVSKLVEEKMKNEGVNVYTNTKAVEVLDGILICEKNGEKIELAFDQILLAIGRKANVTGFGLEELGVELTQRGTVSCDEFLRTNFPNIYVCGDVAGPYQFTHTAAHQAWYASVNALFSPLKKFKVDYSIIPWCTFVDPEVARVGLNEQDAKASGIEYEVSVYPIDDLDRAIAEEEDHGFIKVLTVPGKDTILGVTIVGTHAGDIIAEYVLAMKYGIRLNKILGTIHIYPTLAESNKFVAGVWKRNHAPEKLLEYVRKFHAWRRNE